MSKERRKAAVGNAPSVLAKTLRFGARRAYEHLPLRRRGSVRSVALSSLTGQRCSHDRLLLDLDAFFLEHRLCGDLDGGTSNERAWLACVACGARIERPVETP